MPIKRNPLVPEPLTVGRGGCTETVRIHPMRGKIFLLMSKGSIGKPLNERPTSMIRFDGRQWWDCSYYEIIGQTGWLCVRDICSVRLSNKEFEEIFGKVEVRK